MMTRIHWISLMNPHGVELHTIETLTVLPDLIQKIIWNGTSWVPITIT